MTFLFLFEKFQKNWFEHQDLDIQITENKFIWILVLWETTESFWVIAVSFVTWAKCRSIASWPLFIHNISYCILSFASSPTYLLFDNFAVFSQYQYQYRYQYSIFFNINIKIKILDLKISRSRSISIFWKTWIQYQDQDQHDQYIEKYWKINILSHPWLTHELIIMVITSSSSLLKHLSKYK